MGGFEVALQKLEFDRVRQRVLRHASSELGRAFLSDLSPSIHVDEIRLNLSLVSELKRLFEQESGLPLEGLYPIRESVQKASIEGTVLSPKELWQVFHTLRAARLIRQFISKRAEEYPDIWQLAQALEPDKVLEYNLDQALDESGAIRENASRELRSIRRTLAEKYEQTKKRLATILRDMSDLGFTQDDIITTREGRMVIPVKSEHKNRVHGFIHSASASGATVFIEPSETLDLNNEIRSLHFQEEREVERILRELTKQVGAIRHPLIQNFNVLSELDAISAKALYSIEILGTAPQLTEEGPIQLFQARHPLLMVSHGRDATIPLDLELGKEYDTLIISGPNAGGKSVAMKTVGLLALMTQCGLHIPASDASVLRVFRDVFVDIGDEQSIENDLSTFSSHLSNLKRIVDGADDRSLVLIDEIGSGTDPAEGGAIAAAVLESLTVRGACTIATTHHSALKVFAHNTNRVENGAMEFDQSTLAPTYRFKAGIPGSSYALEMAQRLGFHANMLDRSREFMGARQARLEQLIANLELSSQQYRNQLDEVREEKTKLSELVQKYESKIASQASELKELKRRAVEEAAGIVESANAVIERSIREIKERAADKQSIKQAREDVEKVKDEIEATKAALPEPVPATDHSALGVGTTVKLTGGNETGEIFSVSPDQKSAVVVFGSLKMKVPMKDLQAARKRGSDSRRALSVEQEKPSEVLRDLDLRGMTGEEALPLVDKFIDNAVLAGLHRVDIIHGKGTGALRKKITEHLAHHPYVKSYRLGEWNEGGTGATVVELTES